MCQLLCLLTKDNLSATLELNELITDRVRLALSSAMSSAGVAAAVRHEMALLAAAVQKEDSCWEHRLRSVTQCPVTVSSVRAESVNGTRGLSKAPFYVSVRHCGLDVTKVVVTGIPFQGAGLIRNDLISESKGWHYIGCCTHARLCSS